MKYDFRVGDYVEDVTGRTGYINSICQCMDCEARGFTNLMSYTLTATAITSQPTSIRKDFRATNASVSMSLLRKPKSPRNELRAAQKGET